MKISNIVKDAMHVFSRRSIRGLSWFFTMINAPFLVALIWILITRHETSLGKRRGGGKILIIDNPSGNIDLKSAYKEGSPKHSFIIMSEESLRGVGVAILGCDVSDYTYYSINQDRKTCLRKFIKKVFFYYHKFFKIKAVISQNFNYWALREFANVCVDQHVNYLINYKECLRTPGTLEAAIFKNIKCEGPITCSAISVHNSQTKDYLIRSRLVDGDKIYIVGQARSDFIHQLKYQKKYLRKKIVFFMISITAGLPAFGKNEIEAIAIDGIVLDENTNHSNVAYKTLDFILKFSTDHQDIEVSIKGKHRGEYLNMVTLLQKGLPKNVTFIESLQPTPELIAESDLIIGYNTSALYEALILNKPILIPNIDNEYLNKHYQLPIIPSAKYYDDYADFETKINLMLTNTNCEESFQDEELRSNLIDETLGNSDGLAGFRLRCFLDKFIN